MHQNTHVMNLSHGRHPARCFRVQAESTIDGVLDHLSIQCTNVPASAAFYDAVLAPLGSARVMDFGNVIGYGLPGRPRFWIGPLTTGEPNREIHVAFEAPDR